MSAVDAKPRVARGFRLQWEEAQGCHVLLYPEGMVKLNRSAGEILTRCTGAATVAEIVADLETAFGASNLQGDVESFLDMARQQRWVDAA
ncbi:pyrroloquinoline quinone biosynthesis peptide chaperone PqqD [Sphaerotilus sp.]|uniref:pyrroloquinoline quinone biosynthesis peptide chaperone PqqD n=1 Tax=Sphaerotilus sp. TaxID=2093942 RepID=UPI00286D9812|nr:pyrroloquinoline quinone biosynthesis peptide chaperone PqqD [Sphaerotilus sp.]